MHAWHTNQKALDQALFTEAKGISIANPLSQDQEQMRPSTLPGLISVVASNIHRGQKDIRVFEMGKVYQKREEPVLAMMMTGQRRNDCLPW